MAAEIVDPADPVEETAQPHSRAVGRRVDRAGRISILKYRYHAGRHLAGQSVAVESDQARTPVVGIFPARDSLKQIVGDTVR